MIKEAEKTGNLKKGGTVVEGTSGSTGICLASLCRAKGYRCVIVMPDDQVRHSTSQTANNSSIVQYRSLAFFVLSPRLSQRDDPEQVLQGWQRNQIFRRVRNDVGVFCEDPIDVALQETACRLLTYCMPYPHVPFRQRQCASLFPSRLAKRWNSCELSGPK